MHLRVEPRPHILYEIKRYTQKYLLYSFYHFFVRTSTGGKTYALEKDGLYAQVEK